MTPNLLHRYVDPTVEWERVLGLHQTEPSCWCAPTMARGLFGLIELWHNDPIGAALGTDAFFSVWNLQLLEATT